MTDAMHHRPQRSRGGCPRDVGVQDGGEVRELGGLSEYQGDGPLGCAPGGGQQGAMEAVGHCRAHSLPEPFSPIFVNQLAWKPLVYILFMTKFFTVLVQ